MTIYPHVETAHIACVLKLEANLIDEFSMLKIIRSVLTSPASFLREMTRRPMDADIFWSGATICQWLMMVPHFCQCLDVMKRKINRCQAWMKRWRAWHNMKLVMNNFYRRKMNQWRRMLRKKMSRRRSRCTTPHGHRLHGGSGKECGAETTHFCWTCKAQNGQTHAASFGKDVQPHQSLGSSTLSPSQWSSARVCSRQVAAWALECNLVTMTSGSSFKSNGRCEAETGVIKKSIRVLISAGTCTLR